MEARIKQAQEEHRVKEMEREAKKIEKKKLNDKETHQVCSDLMYAYARMHLCKYMEN